MSSSQSQLIKRESDHNVNFQNSYELQMHLHVIILMSLFKFQHKILANLQSFAHLMLHKSLNVKFSISTTCQNHT